MRAAASVVLACVVAFALASRGHAQPSSADLDRARIMYAAAELAMTESRFADAARDYALAYDASKDPALLFKIGGANERAGKCDVAVDYFWRYLREAKPTPDFVTLTQQRIRICGGNPDVDPHPITVFRRYRDVR